MPWPKRANRWTATSPHESIRGMGQVHPSEVMVNHAASEDNGAATDPAKKAKRRRRHPESSMTYSQKTTKQAESCFGGLWARFGGVPGGASGAEHIGSS